MTITTSNNISAALNLTPVPTIQFEDRSVDLPRDQSEDLRYARENMLHSIEIGHNAMAQVAALAAQAQTPDMYEVLTKLVEVTMKANKDLINLAAKEPSKKEGDVHQTLVVSSTAELLELMQKKKNGG